VSDEPRRTRELIDALVVDLEPVRRFPSLPAALGIVGVAWLVLAALLWRLMHPDPAEVGVKVVTDPWFAAVLVGLGAAALGGSLSAIAGVVPGRETLERGARTVGGTGLVVAVAAGLGATALGLGEPSPALSKDITCFVLGATVGVAPAIALVLLERWGLARRPWRNATGALLGAFGLGGLAVQIGCHYPGARHMLLGHVGVPVVMGAVLLVPLALIVRRFAARRRGGV
jgi:hypothetical protein